MTLVLPRCDPLPRLTAARMHKLCQSSFSLQPNGTASVLSSQKRCQISLSTVIFDCAHILATRQSFSLCCACAGLANLKAILVSCKHVEKKKKKKKKKQTTACLASADLRGGFRCRTWTPPISHTFTQLCKMHELHEVSMTDGLQTRFLRSSSDSNK